MRIINKLNSPLNFDESTKIHMYFIPNQLIYSDTFIPNSDMSNLDEKIAFSFRLKQALTQAKHPISPTYLSKEFNHRYSGQPVSVQSANNWLLGKAIPSQDKLLILSVWLSVSTQWLRFGDQDLENSSNINQINNNSHDLDLLLKLKSLTSSQKQIIENLIEEFSRL